MSDSLAATGVESMRWVDDHLELLDQRKLPGEETYLPLTSATAVADAIRDMQVRGAPAIGIAAAYGLAMAARADPDAVDGPAETLRAARPTAVNLAWAIERVLQVQPAPGQALADAYLAEARAMHAEDLEQNRRMGAIGAELLSPDCRVLTHCNTGALATAGWGTALGVIRSAWAAGKLANVLVDETRPWLQGSRLTAWELRRERIPFRIIADAAAAAMMRRKLVDWVIVGADRIAANGDTANKIGTYALAVAAKHHGLRMMVVAPTSTIDTAIGDGEDIEIEERAPEELTRCGDLQAAPADSPAWNPVFDVTPAELIDVLVTEKGYVRAPDRFKIRTLLRGTAPGPGG